MLGALSLVCFGFVTGVPAMFLGRSAQREIEESGGRLGGSGLATAGFVAGLVGTVMSVLGLVALVGIFVVLGVAADRTLDEIGEIERGRPVPSPTCLPSGGTAGDPLLEACRP